MRRLPHQGARHSTIDHGDASNSVFLLLRGCHGRASTSSSTCGCFLQQERSSSQMISLLSFLSSLWLASRANGSLSLRMAAPPRIHGCIIFTLKKRGWTDTGMGQADRSRPIPARIGRPFTPVGPLDILHFVTSNYINLTTSSSRPWYMIFSHEVRSFTLQPSGMFLCNTSVLTTFGGDFIMLSNTNKTPHLLFWTRCDSVLFVHVLLQKHNTSKCTYKDTKMNLLYH
jgi:hypothetical protein